MNKNIFMAGTKTFIQPTVPLSNKSDKQRGSLQHTKSDDVSFYFT